MRSGQILASRGPNLWQHCRTHWIRCGAEMDGSVTLQRSQPAVREPLALPACSSLHILCSFRWKWKVIFWRMWLRNKWNIGKKEGFLKWTLHVGSKPRQRGWALTATASTLMSQTPRSKIPNTVFPPRFLLSLLSHQLERAESMAITFCVRHSDSDPHFS